MDKIENQFVWVESYRPQKIDDCILSKDLKKTFKSFVEQGEIPNLLLAGGAGVGKTTVAKALCNELDYEYLMINGSDEGRNIDTVRTTIKKFASSMSLTGQKKVVLIDEADYMNPDSVQPALRAFIEEFSNNCRFILTCNYKNKILDPIVSRCSLIEFTFDKKSKPQLMSLFMKRINSILKNEGIESKPKAVAGVIEKHFPDNRRILNELQKYSASGIIDEGILHNSMEISLEKLGESLSSKDFRSIRKWVVDNIDNDPMVLYRKIYNHLNGILESSSIPHAVVIIAEYQYKLAFVADVEINTTAMLVELSANLEFK